MDKLTKKNSLTDYLIYILVILMLAFKDYSREYLIITICSFFVVILGKMKKFNIVNEKKNTRFIINKLIFVAYCLILSCFKPYGQFSRTVILGMCLKIINSITLLFYIDSQDRVDKISKVIVLSSVILCIRLIINVPISAFGHERIGIYLSHDPENSYGYTGITYVLGFAIVMMLTKNDIIKKSWLKWGLIVVFFIFSILSGSKKQIFLLLITMMVMVFYNTKDLGKLMKKILIASVVLLTMFIAIFSNNYLYNAIGIRLIGMKNYFLSEDIKTADDSTVGRANFSSEAKRVFSENIIDGVGLGNFMYYNKYSLCWAENTYLELLADTGIIGFFIYYYIYLSILIDLYRRKKDKSNNNLVIIAMALCYFFVDYTMVTYSVVTLQFYFTYFYCINKVENNRISSNKEVKNV